MDDTDRRLMLLLFEDPRMPVREVARRLCISRQAAHHRLRSLEDKGVFSSMTAAITANYLGIVTVTIWGTSRAKPVEKALARLGESEFTWCVRVAGGNELIVVGGLRDISELDGYVEFVKWVADMPEPTVGIACFGDGMNPEAYDGGRRGQTYNELSLLDLKIIAALSDDVRKPVAEIAKVVGAPQRTVRRHLKDMIADGSIDFDQPFDIPPGEDTFTLLHLIIKGSADKVKVARRLTSIDPIHLIYFRSFSNLPGVLVGLISSDSMAQIRGIIDRIRADDDVVSVTPNLLYHERSFRTWGHKLPMILTRPFSNKRTRPKRPPRK